MATLSLVLNWLNRTLLGPLENLHPAWTMLLVSLLAGVVLLLGFRLLSRQKAVAKAKALVLSDLLAIRLFGSDPLMTLRFFARLLRANLGYLKLTLPPFVILCIPIVFLLVQLDLRFGRRPLRPGETTVLGVRLGLGQVGKGGQPDERVQPDIRVHTGSCLALETPALRIPALSEQCWRLKALAPGVHQVRFELEGRSFTKEVVVGEGLMPASSLRPGPGWLGALAHPWEEPLQGELGVEAVTVEYPGREFSMLGLRMDWVVAFFLLSLIFAFFLRKPLGVEI